MIEGCSRSRAQVGIGTLIVFIAMVLVAALAAGVVIDTSAFLSSKGEHAGKQSSDKVQNRIQVMESTALRTTQDEKTEEKTIGGVELLVSKAPGSDDFFLTSVTIQWVDNTGTYSLVHENHFKYNDDGSADIAGAFAHEPIKDRDNSLQSPSAGEPAINNQDDKASIIIDIGQNDVYEDNRIGEAYENHTYYKDDLSYIKEEDVRDGLSNPSEVSPEPTNADYEILKDGDTNTSYAVGTVIRSDVRYDGGLGLRKQRDAQLSLTTEFGTTTRIRITVPETLTESTALRV